MSAVTQARLLSPEQARLIRINRVIDHVNEQISSSAGLGRLECGIVINQFPADVVEVVKKRLQVAGFDLSDEAVHNLRGESRTDLTISWEAK